MQAALLRCVLAVALLSPASALASPPDAAWKAMLERGVRVVRVDGGEQVGTLVGWDGKQATLLGADGTVLVIDSQDVAELRGYVPESAPAAAPSASPAAGPAATSSASADPAATQPAAIDWERFRKRQRRTVIWVGVGAGSMLAGWILQGASVRPIAAVAFPCARDHPASTTRWCLDEAAAPGIVGVGLGLLAEAVTIPAFTLAAVPSHRAYRMAKPDGFSFPVAQLAATGLFVMGGAIAGGAFGDAVDRGYGTWPPVVELLEAGGLQGPTEEEPGGRPGGREDLPFVSAYKGGVALMVIGQFVSLGDSVLHLVLSQQAAAGGPKAAADARPGSGGSLVGRPAPTVAPFCAAGPGAVTLGVLGGF